MKTVGYTIGIIHEIIISSIFHFFIHRAYNFLGIYYSFLLRGINNETLTYLLHSKTAYLYELTFLVYHL